MRPETEKYLFDIQRAIDRLESFTAGKQYEDYLADELLRSAVERQLLVIGEAVRYIAQFERSVAERIRDYQRIIAFRNRVVHLYDEVDEALVWDVLSSDLNMLKEDVERLLREADWP